MQYCIAFCNTYRSYKKYLSAIIDILCILITTFNGSFIWK
ncbi:hypothetical protein HMPREF0080_00219 [Anaeroglobus geminatus F0357]|uniref:Uncharacterized protein n=1 Tax=Anaeroglobus geminatus F0357 TaxID=861450 RepID=G9YF09_9FIRM|nr:hypothetical protein HMPREF0080_00219 [Anaeroglobus geminatus F0357]